MVKNTTGGSRHKSIARKNMVQEHVARDPEPSNEFEFIARVEKMLGNGMCHVIDIIDKKQYLCYIRGKFRGRQKSHNMVGTNTCVLVGKRPWQSDKKLECDLLCILQEKYGDFPDENEGEDDVIFTNKSIDEDEVVSSIRKERDEDVEAEVNFDDI